MDSEKIRLKRIVFILSIICALLIGYIGGYFTYYYQLKSSLISQSWIPDEFLPAPDLEDHQSSMDSIVPEVDVLFFNPGNEKIWSRNYSEIPAGDGLIKGSIFINDKPAQGIEVALIIAHGRKTMTVKTDEDGNYSVPIKKGNYFLNGIAVYGGKEKLADKIFVNKISKFDCSMKMDETPENEELIKTFDELSEKYGLEEAAKRMSEHFQTTTKKRDEFEFDVGDKPFVFTAFHYRSPIRILAPSSHSKIKSESLKFVWEPYPGAHSYTIEISQIIKKGSSTHYDSVLSKDGINQNFFSPDTNSFEKNMLYGFRVYAYNDRNEVISATSEFMADYAEFTVN
jgi:hypothetical protein